MLSLGEILNAYAAMISRGRKYAGMAGVPLPLSLNDIELYLASRTILIDRTGSLMQRYWPLMMPGGMSGQRHRNVQQIRKEATDLPLMVVHAPESR